MDKLETMKTFIAVVDEGAFSKAAQRLDISPQLVSKYVSHLEDQLQVRLLQRTTRKLNITEAGQTYYERCRQVIEYIDEMENELTDINQNVSGELALSAPMSFGMMHLPKLVMDFQEQYPNIHVNIHLTDRKIDLLEDKVDVVLRIGQLKDSSLIAKRIAPIRLAFYASPNYLKTHGHPKTESDLRYHRYLKYSYSTASKVFEKFESPNELHLKEMISVNNGNFLVNAAIHGGGVVMQPTFIGNPHVAQGELQEILSEYVPAPLGLYVIYAHRKFLAAKVRCFLDFVSHYYGDVPYWDVASCKA